MGAEGGRYFGPDEQMQPRLTLAVQGGKIDGLGVVIARGGGCRGDGGWLWVNNFRIGGRVWAFLRIGGRVWANFFWISDNGQTCQTWRAVGHQVDGGTTMRGGRAWRRGLHVY